MLLSQNDKLDMKSETIKSTVDIGQLINDLSKDQLITVMEHRIKIATEDALFIATLVKELKAGEIKPENIPLLEIERRSQRARICVEEIFVLKSYAEKETRPQKVSETQKTLDLYNFDDAIDKLNKLLKIFKGNDTLC